jgi:hypothetical protein
MHVAASFLPAYLQEIMVKLTLIIALLLRLNSVFSIRRTISRLLSKRFEIKVFDDVHLPEDMSFIAKARNLLQLQKGTNVEVLQFGAAQLGLGAKARNLLPFQKETNIEGPLKALLDSPKEKTYAMRRIQQVLINSIIKAKADEPDLVPGYYLYFGNNNFSKIPAMLCQTNPFFASALTFAQEGDNSYLELIAYTSEPASATDSKYLSFTREMSDPSHRINVRFNMDMTVNKITKFDQDGQATIVDASEWDKYASGAIYNVFYYASAIHSTIHVLHYLMTTAIKSSTAHNTALLAWAEPYDDNIPVKYLEVATLLIQSSLSGRITKSHITKSRIAKATILEMLEDNQIVTGKDGFGASPAIKKDMRDILCS